MIKTTLSVTNLHLIQTRETNCMIYPEVGEVLHFVEVDAHKFYPTSDVSAVWRTLVQQTLGPSSCVIPL